LEIGIYSGGSLGMWRAYFGDRCRIYGVDIEDACKTYADERTSVFIGDQESPAFWQEFFEQVDALDIAIDDGGHTPAQQRVTLEAVLPRLRPGGVYVCEDIQNRDNHFAAYAASLVSELNNNTAPTDGTSMQRVTSPFQQAVHSLHFYPFCLVIEKHVARPSRLFAHKRGTQWQPAEFLR